MNKTSVTFKHPSYVKMQPKWDVIGDTVSGEMVVKSRTVKYLPMPRVDQDDAKNSERYKSYLDRATFYNATGRTLDGIVGQVFSKDPIMTVPASAEYLRYDPAGSGISLVQQAKQVLGQVMSNGRAGLWVDYPPTGGSTTLAELAAGNIRPTITFFKAINIINWRVARVGNIYKLVLVVLQEDIDDQLGEFGSSLIKQFRVLRLTDGVYTSQVYTMGATEYDGQSLVTPRGADGNTLDSIPFVFVGIATNDAGVDLPPLYDLAALNIAHFRNSADFEESCFMLGQPTPWFSGVDQNWVEQVWKGTAFLGARGGIPLPIGGTAGLLQASPNNLVKEAMDHKERQMVALGARLLQEKSVQRTATEAGNDRVTEVSVIAAAALNTTDAYRAAFKFCAIYSGLTDPVEFKLPTDYDIARLSSQEVLAIVSAWQSGAIAFEEMRVTLQRSGYTFLSTKEATAAGLTGEPVLPQQNKVDNNAKPAP